MAEPLKSDIAAEIAGYRPTLFQLAMLQLQDRAAAEDATQDALIAALESQDRFEGRSSVKTWVVSILRYKIIDVMRTQKRTKPVTDAAALADELDLSDFESLFDATGCWASPQKAWQDPHAHVEQVEFFQVLEACLEVLPTNASRVFMMREWLELTSQEVCAETGVTAGHVRVLLYRARMQLRVCMGKRWGREK